MIARITGPVIDHFEKGLVIDTGPLAYSVYTPALVSIGSEVVLYTHMIVREDAHELYGFLTKEEKVLFCLLITVSGVGPKTALGMLTLYTLPDLVSIIKGRDAKAIALVPGIGKKTAEKVVIDLKDKLDGFTGTASTPSADLVEALLSLGYSEQQV